jgi:hypothetical protein
MVFKTGILFAETCCRWRFNIKVHGMDNFKITTRICGFTEKKRGPVLTSKPLIYWGF